MTARGDLPPQDKISGENTGNNKINFVNSLVQNFNSYLQIYKGVNTLFKIKIVRVEFYILNKVYTCPHKTCSKKSAEPPL